ncbi:hypothetical protein BC940DRAFT_364704, partial [Gongronella butleri]
TLFHLFTSKSNQHDAPHRLQGLCPCLQHPILQARHARQGLHQSPPSPSRRGCLWQSHHPWHSQCSYQVRFHHVHGDPRAGHGPTRSLGRQCWQE